MKNHKERIKPQIEIEEFNCRDSREEYLTTD